MVSGYAFANDPDGEVCGGLVEAAQFALADARIKKERVDVINAWGPGHRQIDAGEAKAMMRVFGRALPEIPVVSIKASIGSALGAAPAIQVGVAALALRSGLVPPTVNWEYADPECPLNVSGRVRTVEHSVTLINAHGVGNVNSCAILERC